MQCNVMVYDYTGLKLVTFYTTGCGKAHRIRNYDKHRPYKIIGLYYMFFSEEI